MPVPAVVAALRALKVLGNVNSGTNLFDAKTKPSTGGTPGKITVDIDRGEKWRHIERTLNDPRQTMQIIGRALVGSSQKAFRTQGRGTKKWVARKVPNIAGIIVDLSKGTTIKPRRFRGRPALIDTGQLRDTIAARVVGKSSVEIFSPLDYAGLHQEGGQTDLPITPQVKRNFARKRDKAFKRQFGWLMNPFIEVYTSKITKRPFLTVTKEDVKEAQELINMVADKRQKEAIRRLR